MKIKIGLGNDYTNEFGFSEWLEDTSIMNDFDIHSLSVSDTEKLLAWFLKDCSPYSDEEQAELKAIIKAIKGE